MVRGRGGSVKITVYLIKIKRANSEAKLVEQKYRTETIETDEIWCYEGIYN